MLPYFRLDYVKVGRTVNPPDFIRRRYKSILGASLIGVVATLLCALWLPNQSVIVQSEWRGYDTLYYLRGGQILPKDIVIVSVDADSIAGLAQNRWPLPRKYIARSVKFLHRAHARVIGLDFLYLAPSLYGASDDHEMVSALKSTRNVVVENIVSAGSASNYISQQVSTTDPIDSIAHAAAGVGAANISPDADSVNRSVPLAYAGPGGSRVAAFAVQVAALATHRRPADVLRDLPNVMYVNFVGQQRPLEPGDLTFRVHQLQSVANGEDDPRAFRNKIVLIIPAALQANDVHETPVGQMFGGFLQANILNTILRRNPIQPADPGVNRALLFLVGLAAALAAARLNMAWSTAVTAAIAAGYFGLAVYMFDHYRTWIQVVSPEIAIVLVYALIMAFRFATEERQKRHIKNSFGLYLEPDVVELMVNSPDRNRVLSPARRPVSVLFVDVRGFTAMSERAQPEDIVRALDIYLQELTESIKGEGGSVNKYVGDEIIGVWNYLPVKEQPDHSMRAVRAGLDMIARLDGINEQLGTLGLPPIKYGIGINSGEAVVGEMGSSHVKQYDMIGDAVNTGARLCSAAGGGEIIIGQATWEVVGDKLILEETEPLKLKGKSEPLRTFLVLGLRPETQPVAVATALAAQ